MEKVLLKSNIGEFFSKMYSANKGRDLEVNLMLNDDKIQIYNREDFTFTDVLLVDENPIEELINELSN